MFNSKAIILGTVIYVILGLAGSTSGIWEFYIGIFIAGYMVGKLVKGTLFRGLVHGIIIGLIGAIFFVQIYWSTGHQILVRGIDPSFSILRLFIYSILITAIGGLSGSSAHKLLTKLKKNL
jgi:hypothetical protein